MLLLEGKMFLLKTKILFLDIELYDKVGVLRLLAKASGLLDNPDENDKPSVIDVNVVAPAAGGT